MSGKNEKTTRETPPTSQSIEVRQLSGGRFSQAKAAVVTEKELRLYLNGRHLATASIMPSMEKEFAIGYLFGQGFISGTGDITSITVDDGTAGITLKDPDKLVTSAPSYRIVSGGGRTAFGSRGMPPTIESHITVGRGEIFAAMNRLFERADIYRETEGTHAAGLFLAGGGPVCIAEDIGRHNTLDKIIGYALLNSIDCRRTFLVCTGRMASEMVGKLCRAQVPVVATKTAVTDKGLEIGRACGQTVVGFVRDAGTRINTDMETRTIEEPIMKIYTHPERVSPD